MLIICEQGIGDNIQFFRYLYSIKEKYNAEIYFYTDEKLKHLFKKSPFKYPTEKYLNIVNKGYSDCKLDKKALFKALKS